MKRKHRASDPSGVLVIDKTVGITSHDVVRQVRRTLRLHRVGHAGTLDPMASGVLVVMVGLATKLAPYLTAANKAYEATVSLGLATNTLDAEGETTERAPLPVWVDDAQRAKARLAPALAAEAARTEQQPPVFSAIKVAGKTAYARARAGQAVELAPRAIEVHQLELRFFHPPAKCARDADGAAAPDNLAQVGLFLEVSKGYYVRSLASDLGRHVGLPAHLSRLRRVSSGCFDLTAAIQLDPDPNVLRRCLMPLDAAARRALASVTLSERGSQRARVGQRLDADDFASIPPASCACAWFSPAGRLVAIGRFDENGGGRVLRGFSPTDDSVRDSGAER